jgi:hypothetical protein
VELNLSGPDLTDVMRCHTLGWGTALLKLDFSNQKFLFLPIAVKSRKKSAFWPIYCYNFLQLL